MHPQRKSQGKGAGEAGPENSITEDQSERLLFSIDSDLEAMLREVDEEQHELELILDSVDPATDAAILDGLEQDLEATEALKAWICSKRAEVAERLGQPE
jgi:hypothetical protein